MLQVTDWKDDNFSSRGVPVGAVYYTVVTLKFMKGEGRINQNTERFFNELTEIATPISQIANS